MITGTAYLDLNEDGIHQPGEPGLARVVVSNGRDVTRTDDEGTYQLPDADAEFVFVSLPSGHRLTSPFYHRIGSTSAESFDFELALDDQPAAFTFIHYTDMHLADGHQPVEGFREFIAEVNAMAPPPAFAIGTGDITLQGGAGEVYAKEIDAINVPLYHTMGNHEMLVGQPDPKAAYKALFGPTYYSFNYSGVHFVVMDGHQADPTQEGWKNVIGIVSDRELDWLRADLQQIEAGTPIIGLIHIPLVSTFTERRGLHPLSSPWWEVVNYDEAIDVLAAYNTRLVLQGHMHENERIRYRGIDFITIGAVCGGWWRDPLNPDGSPRGYRIVSVVGGEVASRYKSTGFPYDYQLRIEFPEEEKPKV
ncbi:MAG: metallophosphoesterase, partial [Candidatus Poribacteria bacterium]|nr:metallophosphoesterase [Candidatus Poribacteria bacterium]